jgi:hypothetical protein
MKLLKNVALAAAVAVSVGFVGACASAVPPTTTTTETSTTAPPVTTSHTYYATAAGNDHQHDRDHHVPVWDAASERWDVSVKCRYVARL